MDKLGGSVCMLREREREKKRQRGRGRDRRRIQRENLDKRWLITRK